METIADKLNDIVNIWKHEPASLYIVKLFTTLIASLLAMGLNSWVPPTVEPAASYDYIIVGGGTSGIALASLICNYTSDRVLVIEVGGVTPLTAEIPYIAHTIPFQQYDWNFRTVYQPNACMNSLGLCHLPQGKVLGGSDLFQTMTFDSGSKRDWNRWENHNLPNTTWNWKCLYPYFKNFSSIEELRKYEDFFEESDPLRNLKNVILNSANRLDFPIFKDSIEHHGRIGYGTVYATIKNGRNNHPGRSLLERMIRNKKNVHFMRNTLVTKVKIDAKSMKALGVHYFDSERDPGYISARKEVILTAGAINNVKLLLLSGIGPKTHLDELNIPVVQALEGVGKNLQDHIQFPGIFNIIKRPTWNDQLDDTKAAEEFILRQRGFFTSIGVSSVIGNMHVEKGDRSDYPNVRMKHFYIFRNLIKETFFTRYGFGKDVECDLRKYNKRWSLLVQIPTLTKPKSRGVVTLYNSNPFTPPKIDPKFLSDPDDVRSLVCAAKHAQRMVLTEEFQSIHAEFVNISERVCPHCKDSCKISCPWKCLIQNFATSAGHPVGTTKMGRCGPCDESVVNNHFQVHGIDNLRVADASVMPEIISGDLYASKIILPLRAAEFIIKRRIRSVFQTLASIQG